jgi:hypothetical protein
MKANEQKATKEIEQGEKSTDGQKNNEDCEKVGDNDSEQKEKVNVFGKQLNSLDEISAADLKNYLFSVLGVFNYKSYSEFTNNDITALVAYKYLVQNGDTYKDINEIKSFVKSLFGIDNFELKEGKYTSPIFNNEQIIISKKGDRFVSNLMGKGEGNFGYLYVSKEVKNDQVIVHYDLAYDDDAQSWRVTKGKTDVYLKYQDGNLVINKIVYKSIY